MAKTALSCGAGGSSCMSHAWKTSISLLLPDKAAGSNLSSGQSSATSVRLFGIQPCFPKHRAPSGTQPEGRGMSSENPRSSI